MIDIILNNVNLVNYLISIICIRHEIVLSPKMLTTKGNVYSFIRHGA